MHADQLITESNALYCQICRENVYVTTVIKLHTNHHCGHIFENFSTSTEWISSTLNGTQCKTCSSLVFDHLIDR